MQYYPINFQPRKLSVIGAMKDIQEYKIMKARADIAPTLVERAKLELAWDKEDRPDDLKLKKQSIKKGEQDIVANERKNRLNYINDSANLGEWILEGKDQEEKLRRYDIYKRLITKTHEDQVTSVKGKPGDMIPEFDEEKVRAMVSMARKKAEELAIVPAGARMADPVTGEVKLEAEYKQTEDKDPKTMVEDWLKKHPDSTDAEKIAFAQSMKAKGIKMTLPDGTEIEIGGPQTGLTAPTTTNLQKSLVGLTKQLSDLGAIDTAKFTDALTIPGKVKKFALRTADKMKIDIGKEGKEYLGKTRVFIESIEQVFNQYRKEITGAQAAMKEIAMLRESILNKEMSPTEFEYSFNSYVSKVKRMMRITRSLLREGFTNEKGALGQELESRFYATGDVADTEVDSRGDEIAESLKGKYDDTEEGQKQLGQAVYKQLMSEGYNLGQ